MGSDFVNWPTSVWVFYEQRALSIIAGAATGTHKHVLWVPCFPFSAP